MATNIGMMDGAYFVGRSEILAWINSTLHLSLSKVEEVLFLSHPFNPSVIKFFSKLVRIFLGCVCVYGDRRVRVRFTVS